MDYVVGSVAALISGNVTPSRPKILKRALTPIKHQQSPNVTPKSELVNDRSIFLSPTMQKKKAIVKKSPKRIFANHDLDVTNEELNISVSPKADKVKKHLVEQLENSKASTSILLSPKSPKKSKNDLDDISENPQNNEEMKHKKKKKCKPINQETLNDDGILKKTDLKNLDMSKHKAKKRNKSKSINTETSANDDIDDNVIDTENSNVNVTINKNEDNQPNVNKNKQMKKKKNKHKKKNGQGNNDAKQIRYELKNELSEKDQEVNVAEIEKNKKSKNKTVQYNVEVNPNAITHQDTDSEHDSDNEVNSDDEENKQVLDTGPPDSSDDEETKVEEKKGKKETETTNNKQVEEHTVSEDEIKRTLFVGNVPFSNKCKKEIKKTFSKFGDIETVRIRTVPVKDARTTPKLAVIKNELHPDRQTVNVYIKYKETESVGKALSANNTVLREHHLRVSRSDTTGAHDPRRSVFVGNLPFAMEDEALRAVFQKCGEIHSVRIIRDRKTNAGKGFGYVNFASKDGVELALALTEEDLTIKNRIIRVKRCTQFSPKQAKNSPQKFQPQVKHNEEKGALKRINHKRKFQENKDGPPNKREKTYQPEREKKQRKEFVGMTAEKKKKRKFSKGQKQKKVLSEILTK